MRDLKELNWRSRGPKLPTTVLDAATLRIGAPLPEPYRLFLSQMDGGRVGRGSFRAAGRDWRIAGFYCFADAAALMEKLKKAARIPTNFLPVAYIDETKQQDTPLVFLELNGEGRSYIKGSNRTKWEDPNAVTEIGSSFGDFVDLLGDPPAEPLPVPTEEAAPAAVEAPPPPPPAPLPARASTSQAAPRHASTNGSAPRAAGTSTAAPRPATATASTSTLKARPPVKPAAAKPVAKPAAKAAAKPAPRAAAKAKPAKKAPAKKAKPAAKAKTAATKKKAVKRVAVKAGRGRR